MMANMPEERVGRRFLTDCENYDSSHRVLDLMRAIISLGILSAPSHCAHEEQMQPRLGARRAPDMKPWVARV